VPLLLLLLCARQGSFEATAVYMVARALAAMNLRRLAEAQGLVAPTAAAAEKQVAMREGELVGEVAAVALGLLAVSYILGLLLGLFLLWQLGSFLFAALDGPPPDPFAGL